MIFNETITFSLRDTLRPKFPSLYPPPPTLQIYPVYIKSRNFFDPNVTDSIIERKLLSIILLINFINRFSSILSAVDKSFDDFACSRDECQFWNAFRSNMYIV